MVFFTPTEIVFGLPNPPSPAVVQAMHNAATKRITTDVVSDPAEVLRLRFMGANATPTIQGDKQLPGIVNYFIGNDPAKWSRNVPSYEGIVYKNLYAGVDLHYGGRAEALKGTFTLAAGANPAMIGWRYIGATNVRLDAAKGELLIRLPGGRTLIEHAPVAWQERNGQKIAVQVGYTVAADERIGFTVGSYDRSLPLVIDPELTYSTYIGGRGTTDARGITVDGSGSLYVTGMTTSLDFPSDPNLTITRPSSDAFVVKFVKVSETNYTPATPGYISFVGSFDGFEGGNGIAIDPDGNAYFVSNTSAQTGYPCVNAYQCGTIGQVTPVVTKLDPTGAILYSTYIGHSYQSSAFGIAIDAGRNIYIVGQTSGQVGSYLHYPQMNAIQSFGGGSRDGFVTKIKAAGDDLHYSTYLGGNDEDWISSVAVDSAGNAYFTGGTTSTDFVANTQIPNARGEGQDAFVVKLNEFGNTRLYSTYLGGLGSDYAVGIAVDNNFSAYIVGTTNQQSTFPKRNPITQPNTGSLDVFITKLTPAGNDMAYSTLLAGSSGENGFAIAVDNAGSAYVTGNTASTNMTLVNPLPYPREPFRPDGDAFIARITPAGAAFDFLTYLGGAQSSPGVFLPLDTGKSIAVDNAGNVYIAGSTFATDYPRTQNAYQQVNISDNGAGSFISKVSLQGLQPPTLPIFTNLRLTGRHQALQSSIFWAIYGETSEDTYFSGKDQPLTTPYDQTIAGYVSYLGTSPYCQNDANAASGEQITVPPWQNGIKRIEHCYNHRYVFAQVIINGFLNYERVPKDLNVNYDATNDDQVMGKVFGYIWSNFRQSAGNAADVNPFWSPQIVCRPSGTSNASRYSNYPALVRDIRAGRALRADAVKWLDNYLQNCQNPNSRIKQSYTNSIKPQIVQAITDFNNQLPDPTREDKTNPNSPGAFNVRAANLNGNAYSMPVGCLSGQPGCSTVNFYSPQWNDTMWTDPQTQTSSPVNVVVQTYYQNHINQIKAYNPVGVVTVLQPALRFDPADSIVQVTNPLPRGGLRWYTFSYQQADITQYTPRYIYNVCTGVHNQGQHIQNCLVAQQTP
jgi:hypothetical protein